MENKENYLEIESIHEISNKLVISDTKAEIIINRLKNEDFDGIKIIKNTTDFLNSKDGSLKGYAVDGKWLENSDLKVIFTEEIKIENFCFDKLIFNNCTFNKKIFFNKININSGFDIVDCNFKNDLNISGGDYGKGIFINVSTFEANLFLNNIKGDFVNIEGFNNFLNKLTIVQINEIYRLLIGDLNIGEIEINLSTLPDDTIFRNLDIIKNFKIINSNLLKTTFNGVNIEKLYLENATLNDCIFNGVEFPKNYKLEKLELSNKQLKDNYRQLKFVMDKNGNYTEGNKFYEKEMEYEMLSLGVSKGFFNGLKSLFDNKFLGEESKKIGSRIQLWFGWEFNEFGNNWPRTLFLIFLWAFISVILNILYNYFFNITICDYFIFGGGLNYLDFFNFNIIKDYFKLFLNLLYPLYGLKKDYIDGLDNWLTLGFILYKTIYGILLWHLVVALKRTTKR